MDLPQKQDYLTVKSCYYAAKRNYQVCPCLLFKQSLHIIFYKLVCPVESEMEHQTHFMGFSRKMQIIKTICNCPYGMLPFSLCYSRILFSNIVNIGVWFLRIFALWLVSFPIIKLLCSISHRAFRSLLCIPNFLNFLNKMCQIINCRWEWKRRAENIEETHKKEDCNFFFHTNDQLTVFSFFQNEWHTVFTFFQESQVLHFMLLIFLFICLLVLVVFF